MNEVLVDLRNYDLSNRLEKDMISVETLTRILEDTLDKVDMLEEEIKVLKQKPDEDDPDAYDRWRELYCEHYEEI